MVKRKSVQYLETCPQELRKWVTKCATSRSDGLTGLYLCLCREPRLQSVLSKQPQLREDHSQTALLTVQRLYREDVEAAWQQRLAAAGVQVPASYSFSEARAEADRRVASWLNAEDGCYKSQCDSSTTASSGDEAVQQEPAPQHTVADLARDDQKSLQVTSSIVEKRIDPDDGKAYTYDEMSAHYKGEYRQSAVAAYWNACQVAGGQRRGFRRRNNLPRVKASNP